MAGKPQEYDAIAPGATLNRGTFAGHVWQAKGKGGRDFGVYVAADTESQVVLGATATPKTGNSKSASKPQNKPATERGFVRQNNLWLRDADGKEIQVTRDGTAENFYRGPLRFSPDGKFLIVMQVQPAQTRTLTLVDSAPDDQLQPKIKTVNYLKPGDRLEIERPRLFDVAARREVPTSHALFRNPYDINELGWSADSQRFLFRFNQRGHQHLRVLSLETGGQVRAIVDEQSATFIDYSQKTYLHLLPKTDELIWASERDGWNHLYLYDSVAGALKNQVTRGNWVMREVVRVDEAKRQIWFRAFGLVPGQDPYYSQLARINFDGSDLTILTEGDGNHSWQISPDERFLVDTFSRVDMAPVTNLRDAQSGQLVRELERADLEPLKAAGWSVPERFEAPGRDGKTPIYGLIIRPSDFDPNKKYPVIEDVYAGPHDFFVPKSFGLLQSQHELAELGFIVVKIDGMGTNWRSRAFHEVCWKNIKDAGLPDRIAWMKAAQTSRPWMDLERVGIYGVSAGAQSALGALLFHGNFYKAAFSDCGCHDNRMDKLWWNEAWMGWPVGPQYADNSNVVHAANLKGALFLTVGELDTNVDPSSTLQVVDALIKADKRFDFLMLPGKGHGAGLQGTYGANLMRDFFVRNLLKVEPPPRNG